MAADTMSADHHTPPLAWLQADDAFPPVEQAWGPETIHPGLLAAGGMLDSAHLQ